MTIKIKRNLIVTVLSMLIVSLSGCGNFHDGKGMEHEPGESEIKHRH